MIRKMSNTFKYAIRWSNGNYYGGIENPNTEELEEAQAFDTKELCSQYIASNLDGTAIAILVAITRVVNEHFEDLGLDEIPSLG